MDIIFIVIGVGLVAYSDKLQPDQFRKPKLNIYLGTLGGFVWLVGIILCFLHFSILVACSLLIGSFSLGALLGIKGNTL